MEHIKYFIKFFQKEEYIKVFLDEQSFYANPAGFYWYASNGQGDAKEGSCLSRPFEQVIENARGVDIKSDSGTPVFCCYMVSECCCKDNSIIGIDKRCLTDFLGETGKAVVLSRESLMSAISSCQDVKKYDCVVYHLPQTFNEEYKCLTGNSSNALFYKSADYSYQNEFRIAFNDWIQGTVSKYEDGVRLWFGDSPGRKYKYDGPINPIGIYTKESFVEKDGKYELLL